MNDPIEPEKRATVVLRRPKPEKGYGFVEVLDGDARGAEAICSLEMAGMPVHIGEPFPCILQQTSKGWRVVRRADPTDRTLAAARGVVRRRASTKADRPYWEIELTGDAAGGRVLVWQQQLLDAGLSDLAPGVAVVLDAEWKGTSYWAKSLVSPTAADAFAGEDRVERPAWLLLDGAETSRVTLAAWDHAGGVAVAAGMWRSQPRAWGIRQLAVRAEERRGMTDHELSGVVAASGTELRSSGGVAPVDTFRVEVERQRSGDRVRWFVAAVLEPRCCRAATDGETVDWVWAVAETSGTGAGSATGRPAGYVRFTDARVGSGLAPYFPDVRGGTLPLEDGSEVCVTLKAARDGWRVQAFNVVANPKAVRA